MRKAVLPLIAAIGAAAAWQSDVFPALRSTSYAGKQAAGFYLLPTHQLLRPWGEQITIAGRPVDMAFDAEKHTLAVLNIRSVLLFDGTSGARTAEIKTKPTSYTGIAFRPGTRELWVSETLRNGPDSIAIITISDAGQPSGELRRIPLRGHPLPAGIAFNRDGTRAYIAFSRSNSLAVVDAESREVLREFPTGLAPFGVAVSDKAGKVFVTNRAGRRPTPDDVTAPSSGTNVVTAPQTGSTSSGSVTVVDEETGKTSEIAVGLAPSAIAASPDQSTFAVANGHSDTVTIINSSTLTTRELKIPVWPENSLGSQPVAVAFAQDGKTLYVGSGGNNAVVIARSDAKGWSVQGAIPTGWFPSAIAVDAKGGLRVLNIKGVGNTADRNGGFNSRAFEGSLSAFAAPGQAQLAAGMREVRAANMPQFEPAGGIANLSSLGIEHVLFVIKENRTYDQVFGDIGKGNSDPGLAIYGREVTPNHHALAEKYVLLDNFYTGGAISFDGHHWLMQAFVSDYVERAFASSPRGYAWNMADALTVAPTGFFWQGAPKPPSVRIYGEFCLPAKWDPEKHTIVDINESEEMTWAEYWKAYKDGTWQSAVGCSPGIPALRELHDVRYPHSTTIMNDQIRAEAFLRALREFEQQGSMPNIMVLTLNSDHTNGTRPGSPTPKAMVADNDLALGRIVQGMSKSKFWAKSLILVVEDDAQDGVDHVDGHRTVALAVGPHVRRGAVDSNFYTHTSMVRTIQEVFRIPQRTRYLKSARPMSTLFLAEARPEQYEAITPKQPLDQMNPPLQALAGRRLWAARQSAGMNFRDVDDVPQDVLNRILWWDAKGYDVAFPGVREKGR